MFPCTDFDDCYLSILWFIDKLTELLLLFIWKCWIPTSISKHQNIRSLDSLALRALRQIITTHLHTINHRMILFIWMKIITSSTLIIVYRTMNFVCFIREKLVEMSINIGCHCEVIFLFIYYIFDYLISSMGFSISI